MKETEITVQVFNNYDKIDEILKKQGFKMIENYQLYDWYFSKFENVLNVSYIDLMNNSFLVRNIVDDCPKIQLCYKKKELDEFNNVLMEEKVKANLTDIESVIKIFNLAGLNNYCKVENNSFVYKKEKIELAVQIIKDLGIFIEYEETEDMNNLSAKQKFDYMVNVVNNLGLELGKDYSCKKVFMLLHSNT